MFARNDDCDKIYVSIKYSLCVGANLMKIKDAKAYGSEVFCYDSRAARFKLLGGSSSI